MCKYICRISDIPILYRADQHLIGAEDRSGDLRARRRALRRAIRLRPQLHNIARNGRTIERRHQAKQLLKRLETLSPERRPLFEDCS